MRAERSEIAQWAMALAVAVTVACGGQSSDKEASDTPPNAGDRGLATDSGNQATSSEAKSAATVPPDGEKSGTGGAGDYEVVVVCDPGVA